MSKACNQQLVVAFDYMVISSPLEVDEAVTHPMRTEDMCEPCHAAAPFPQPRPGKSSVEQTAQLYPDEFFGFAWYLTGYSSTLKRTPYRLDVTGLR